MHYLSQLFSSTNPVFPNHLNDLIQPSISVPENSFLCSIPDVAEVKVALLSMSSHKSPRPDGFNPLFFKLYWNIVQESLVAGVQFFFKHGRLNQGLNHIYIALILKIDGATRMEKFRPIALCNVGFKIITKIMANRLWTLLDKLVALIQAAFVLNRNIQDNTIFKS